MGGRFCEDMIKRKNAIEGIKDAAGKWGFFQVINHGVSLDLLEKMKDGVRGFHEQSPEVRKEFYSRDFNRKFTYLSKFSPCVISVSYFRDVMMEYSKQVANLGEYLFELLSEALGLKPNHLSDMDCLKGLRILCHYFPPCPEPDLTLGSTQHSDSSFLTVLLPDQIEGLQVLREGYWFDVPHVPGALIINIGDLLQLITNDKFISLEHRVLANRATRVRVSVACFFTTHVKPNPRVYDPLESLCLKITLQSTERPRLKTSLLTPMPKDLTEPLLCSILKCETWRTKESMD